MNQEVIKNGVCMLLNAIEPNNGVSNSRREGLRDTPDRVARMYTEMFNGYEQNASDILSAQFTNDAYREGDPHHSNMVIVKDIEFFSHCEHHMVPFFGSCHIGYVPGKKVVGISKLGRLVQCYAHRLQIQERMTTQIADAIMLNLDPEGCMVVIDAQHLCTRMRGLRNPTARTVTSAVRGVYREQSPRQEFMSLIGMK